MTTKLMQEFERFQLIVNVAENEKLICGDSIFLYEVIEGYSIIPISPNFFISIKPIKKPSYYNIIETNDGLISEVNKMISTQSNNWIVAKSINQLKKYEEEFLTLDKKTISYVSEESPYSWWSYK